MHSSKCIDASGRCVENGPGKVDIQMQRVGNLLERDQLEARSPSPSPRQNGIQGHLNTMNPADLDRLVTLEMPFGKHKGCLIADLPGNYLNWFAREGFPEGEIGRLLALMQEIDHNGLKDILKPLRQRPGR
jgi:uncharacterized protein (DUF3820 family)